MSSMRPRQPEDLQDRIDASVKQVVNILYAFCVNRLKEGVHKSFKALFVVAVHPIIKRILESDG